MRHRPVVLMIDDDQATRAAVAGILRQEGVVVAEAPDGQAGFQRAIETLPDLIITDISMPIMNGWELIRRLRADDRARDIPVIVCSGGERPPAVELEVEPSAYMRKPCEPDELRLEVRRLLGRPALEPRSRPSIAGPLLHPPNASP
jgi:CheY-like chemotaxis protein